MQNLVSREVAGKETAVLTVGQILAGTKHNIIPATVVMRGSLRTFNPTVREQIVERLGTFVSSIAHAYQADTHLSFQGEGCPNRWLCASTSTDTAVLVLPAALRRRAQWCVASVRHLVSPLP
jgi:metal-dependent amidase/aminoacylase/carboxypeptidase family protein